MDITKLISFFAALSVATERVTEIVKGLPLLSEWFAATDKTGTEEELRKASVQFVAVAAGILVCIASNQIITSLNVPGYTDHKYLFSVIFGLLASGGSGIWNSALDIVREVNTQKQIVTEKMKKA